MAHRESQDPTVWNSCKSLLNSSMMRTLTTGELPAKSMKTSSTNAYAQKSLMTTYTLVEILLPKMRKYLRILASHMWSTVQLIIVKTTIRTRVWSTRVIIWRIMLQRILLAVSTTLSNSWSIAALQEANFMCIACRESHVQQQSVSHIWFWQKVSRIKRASSEWKIAELAPTPT